MHQGTTRTSSILAIAAVASLAVAFAIATDEAPLPPLPGETRARRGETAPPRTLPARPAADGGVHRPDAG